MAFFSALIAKGKRPDHDQEAGGNHDQQDQQQHQQPSNNFFSKIFNKRKDHEEVGGNHDPEAGGGNHDQHGQQQHQQPWNNFFSEIFNKRKDQEEAGGNHDQHDQQQPSNNFFSNIFDKKKEHEGGEGNHDQEAGGNHDQHDKKQPSNNFLSNIFDKKKEHEVGEGNHDEHKQSNLLSRILHKKHEEGGGHHFQRIHHFFSRFLNRVELFNRVSTLVFLVAGVVVLIIDQVQNISSASFLDLVSYKYIFAAIIIAQAYILLQIGLSLFRLMTGVHRGFLILYFDFFGDKILTYLLATGAAAAFGASLDSSNSSSSMLNQGKTAASLVLIAFLFSAISSIISSHLLPKHAWHPSV